MGGLCETLPRESGAYSLNSRYISLVTLCWDYGNFFETLPQPQRRLALSWGPEPCNGVELGSLLALYLGMVRGIPHTPPRGYTLGDSPPPRTAARTSVMGV